MVPEIMMMAAAAFGMYTAGERVRERARDRETDCSLWRRRKANKRFFQRNE
jgi:hypothetical protein